MGQIIFTRDGHDSSLLFGTYTVSPDGKILTLQIEASTWQNCNGAEQKRNLALLGDQMKYTAAASIGGSSEITYERVK